MMRIDTKYDIGEYVYLKTDPDQYSRLITRMIINPLGIMYELSLSSHSSYHYEMEFTEDKNIIMTTTN